MHKQAQNWIKLESPLSGNKCWNLFQCTIGQRNIPFGIVLLGISTLQSNQNIKRRRTLWGNHPNEWNVEGVCINIMLSFPSLPFLFDGRLFTVWKQMEINLLLHSDSIIEFRFSVGIYWTWHIENELTDMNAMLTVLMPLCLHSTNAMNILSFSECSLNIERWHWIKWRFCDFEMFYVWYSMYLVQIVESGIWLNNVLVFVLVQNGRTDASCLRLR